MKNNPEVIIKITNKQLVFLIETLESYYDEGSHDERSWESIALNELIVAIRTNSKIKEWGE